MLFKTSPAQCILFVAFVQLVGNAAVIENHRIKNISDTKALSKSMIEAPNRFSKTKRSTTTNRNCPGKSEETCQIEEGVAWQLQWISTMNVDTNPWKTMGVANILSWNFHWSYNPAWGSDVIIFVIDSGVNKDHPTFERNQVQPGDTISRLEGDVEADASTSVDGHGTAAASLIVGRMTGIARKGRIHPIKVATSTKIHTSDDMAEAITIALDTWRVRSRENPALRAIINISGQVFHTLPTLEIVQSALDAGMHVVMAAGNEGINACYEDTETPNERTFLRSIGQIVVSGTRFSRVDGIVYDEFETDYNYGSCVDIVAPGDPVVVAKPTNWYATSAGTSKSAALVSGALAALLSSGSAFRDLQPNAMKNYFLDQYGQNSGVHGVPGGTVNKRLVIEGLV